jgi:hypothetical protein
VIIAYMGKNVNEYRKNFLRYIEGLETICPKCGSATIFHDNYNRYLRIGENVELIVIQRVVCCGCGKTHAIIPDFIRPYKHYVIADIEGVLRGIYSGISYEHVETPASISTIKRWYREFKVWALMAI